MDALCKISRSAVGKTNIVAIGDYVMAADDAQSQCQSSPGSPDRTLWLMTPQHRDGNHADGHVTINIRRLRKIPSLSRMNLRREKTRTHLLQIDHDEAPHATFRFEFKRSTTLPFTPTIKKTSKMGSDTRAPIFDSTSQTKAGRRDDSELSELSELGSEPVPPQQSQSTLTTRENQNTNGKRIHPSSDSEQDSDTGLPEKKVKKLIEQRVRVSSSTQNISSHLS
ncbi:hypothetical protein C8J57DRAFT_262579 [Mycena rebaudengoi]|nr:hypothetical protein C8J57DRAFT_262579 [Mycena rebaudengoi]